MSMFTQLIIKINNVPMHIPQGRVWSLHRVRYKRGAVVPLQRPHGARRGLARRRQLQALHTLLHPQGTVAVTPIPTSILTILTLVHSD